MTNTEKLLKLVKENPELPIVPMVYHEIADEDYGYWMGGFGECEAGEYAVYDERFYTERDDLKEEYFCHDSGYFDGLSNDEVEKLLEEKTNHLWKKAIIVYIELPD